MAGNFDVRILTPAGVVYSGKAAAVKLETAEGQIQILTQHAKYTGLLGTGILLVEGGDGAHNERCVISGGFCSYENDTLLVLADTADLPRDVEGTNYASGREELEKTIAGGNLSDPTVIFAQQKLARIKALEELLGGSRN